MLLLLFHTSVAPVGPDSDQYERYIRSEFTATTLVDDLEPAFPSTTLTTALGPTFTLVP